MAAHAGVLEALIERGITGRGKGLKVSLFDGMADWMNVPLLYLRGHRQGPASASASRIRRSAPMARSRPTDGALVLISIQNEREWAEFCAHFLDEPDLPKRAGFETNVDPRRQPRRWSTRHIAATFAAPDPRRRRRRSCAPPTPRMASSTTSRRFRHHPALRRATVRDPERRRSPSPRRRCCQRRRAPARPGAGDRRALGRDPRRVRRLRLAAEAAWRRLEGEADRRRPIGVQAAPGRSSAAYRRQHDDPRRRAQPRR